MQPKLLLSLFLCLAWNPFLWGAAFDAAPFALPLPEGNGLLWEDPRELHQVVVQFSNAVPNPATVRLEYWGSRWPDQRLPKDREPGGGDVGWMELGNWHQGGWRTADAEIEAKANHLTFKFRPVNIKEFTALKDYPAAFRYTLKIRLASDKPLPAIARFEAFTDSVIAEKSVLLAWKVPQKAKPTITGFNGQVSAVEKVGTAKDRLRLSITTNPDPNTFDRTLATVAAGTNRFTFAVDDLNKGPLFIPAFGVAILPEGDARDYAALEQAQKSSDTKTLYEQVVERPEQTWPSAWAGVPRKKSLIYFPLGLDGGRQRFQLHEDGSIVFRSNDNYLRGLPGKETARLDLEGAPVGFRFGPTRAAVERHLEPGGVPICETTWEANGLRVTQTALVTELAGSKPNGPVPAPDATAVFLARFTFTNTTASSQTASLPLSYSAGDKPAQPRLDANGFLWLKDKLRGQVLTPSGTTAPTDPLAWSWKLQPGEAKSIQVKIPYVLLESAAEQEQLARLDFEVERAATAGYWGRRMDESARLLTPEPVIDQFYRSHARHLLVNCEREPGSERRFARVGSFSYGAYGNESCMMVVDLDRRGLHQEARECLDAWLHYQGTVMLPGDFASQKGILYGAGGYEAGGYNQHHGWILWCLAEHYRFTRDQEWLRQSAPGILSGADWIISETARTAARHPLERGLLPAGSLEDIGDWWTWLSTSCYTWRGLDSAAWALEEIKHPEATRVRRAAAQYHANLLANFTAAAERSPVVRLRNGTAVPHFPSQVHRRGRSFGWICETLEGALHLLITGALNPRSPQAEWILNDYEDNLYLSNQYGYTLDDFDRYWFGRGGMSMQACLLLDVEPYLYRDDVKSALRALFNGLAVSHFPDVHMNTEHALPDMADWRGDHFKSSDEANACGWLRYLFVRESGNELLVGQAIPQEWLSAGKRCGLEKAATHFGSMSILYTGGDDQITARLEGPLRNPPKIIRVRFRQADGKLPKSVTVNNKPWSKYSADWVELPGDIGKAEIVVAFKAP
jgi:hypothetical protein